MRVVVEQKLTRRNEKGHYEVIKVVPIRANPITYKA